MKRGYQSHFRRTDAVSFIGDRCSNNHMGAGFGLSRSLRVVSDQCSTVSGKARRVVAKVEWHPGELYPRVGFILTNLARPAARVVVFYNQRGTAEQRIKEGKNAIQWTRLSCRKFAHNAVRLQLHALAYNLGNFLRTLALPDAVQQWSMTTLRDRLIKIGAKIVRHGRYVTFQMAEVAIPRDLFADILRRIDRLRPKPCPA